MKTPTKLTLLRTIGLGFFSRPQPEVIYKLLASVGFKFFINVYNQHSSQREIDIIKHLHPHIFRGKVSAFSLFFILIEFTVFIVKCLDNNRMVISPLLLYIIFKFLLFLFIRVYDNICIPELIIPVISGPDKYQIINLGYRLSTQFLLHVFIYLFIAATQTIFLLALFPTEISKTENYVNFLLAFWMFGILAAFKEFFISLLEISTPYYKLIHAMFYITHSLILLAYIHFWKRLTKNELITILFSAGCFLLATVFYIFFSPPSFVYELFCPFIFLGTFFAGFPIWNRFLHPSNLIE
ncbi:hypothetical protein CDIK_2444 [Cucumispora dikerogammari]|nr:hypothetical protein CDIK_2444 [Cucumispora dikerogammari]